MATTTAADPCAIVIFGASGDLTKRKLIPALYELFTRGQLPDGTFVVGTARTPMSDEEFRESMRPWTRDNAKGFDEPRWKMFAKRVSLALPFPRYLSEGNLILDSYVL